MLKRIATLAVMALITTAVSIPVEAGVGGCSPRAGVGGCGGWWLSTPTVETEIDSPGTYQVIEEALPVHIRILARLMFGRTGANPAPAPVDSDTTTLGVGGCTPRAGVGGCKF